jgi:hypothetical protein
MFKSRIKIDWVDGVLLSGKNVVIAINPEDGIDLVVDRGNDEKKEFFSRGRLIITIYDQPISFADRRNVRSSSLEEPTAVVAIPLIGEEDGKVFRECKLNCDVECKYKCKCKKICLNY